MSTHDGEAAAPVIAVTGADGFVGRATVARLRAAGLKARPLHRAQLGDLASDAPIPDDALRGCSAVIHLAARAHVMADKGMDGAALYDAVNVGGSLKLLAAARRAGVARFVFVSSIKVAAEATAPGTAIGIDAPAAPVGAYAISKAQAERRLREESEGIELVIVRPTLVYGPGVKANMRALIGAVARGMPLPLGGIANARSLISVNNLADALRVCAVHAAAPGHAWVVADGPAVSTPRLVRAIAAASGRRARLLDVPLPLMRALGRLTGRADAIDRVAGSLAVDDSGFRERLGWIPVQSFEAGVAAMVEAMR